MKWDLMLGVRSCVEASLQDLTPGNSVVRSCIRATRSFARPDTERSLYVSKFAHMRYACRDCGTNTGCSQATPDRHEGASSWVMPEVS
jgi:hypothetical protein